MARSRNIKPGFFKNEHLVELDFATRLLFAGLWTQADREGRLEDRPKKIKMEIFPADDVPVDSMLDALQSKGFITRYEVLGERYIQVNEFLRHQAPHGTERDSEIPDQDGMYTVHTRLKNGYATSETQKLPSALTVKAPDKNALIPDSLLLIPLNKEPSGSCPGEGPNSLANCPFDKLIDLYVEKLPMLPTVRRSLFKTGKGGTAMKARWKWVMTAFHERGERVGQRLATTVEEGVEWFGKFFAYVAASDFLTGKSGKFNGCTLQWLMPYPPNPAPALPWLGPHQEIGRRSDLSYYTTPSITKDANASA